MGHGTIRVRRGRRGCEGHSQRTIPMRLAHSSSGSGPAQGFAECAHSVSNLFNSRLGNISHVGLAVSYSNPGTLVLPVGLKVFPLKGHDLVGWYVYRAMVDTTLLEVAFAPELAGRAHWQDAGTTKSGASGSGSSIRTLTSACRGASGLRVRGTKTWRGWPTATPTWLASSPVPATTRR